MKQRAPQLAKSKSDTHVEEQDSGDVLSKDEIFQLLQNRRRRHVFHFLKQHSEPVTIGAIADQITAWEHGVAKS